MSVIVEKDFISLNMELSQTSIAANIIHYLATIQKLQAQIIEMWIIHICRRVRSLDRRERRFAYQMRMDFRAILSPYQRGRNQMQNPRRR